MSLNRDQLIFLGYAVLSAGVTLSAAHGWVSKDDADTIGSALLAFAAAYHIPSAKAAAALADAKAVPPPAEPPVDPEAAGRSE